MATKEEFNTFISNNMECLVDPVELSEIKNMAKDVCSFKPKACGHIIKTTPRKLTIKNNDICCRYCLNLAALPGVNTIGALRPDLVPYLKDKTDAEKYTVGSNKDIIWSCPKCKRDFVTSPNRMRKRKNYCKYCAGREVIPGVNTIGALKPDLVLYLKDKTDAEKYTIGSNKNLIWCCPKCKREFTTSPNRMCLRKNYCQYCSVSYSFVETFLKELFDYLFLPYIWHYVPEWSDRKEYDFYLPVFNTIVEVYGKQHYEHNGFEKMSNITLDYVQYNDEVKYELAKKHVNNYIVIDYSIEDYKHLKHSILSTDLLLILQAFPDEINWEIIAQNASMYSPIVEACKLYMDDKLSISEICEILGKSYGSVFSYLKKGTEMGICNYNPVESRLRVTHLKSMVYCSKPVSQYSKTGEFIRDFPGIQQARRETGINHIWDAVTGRRKYAGGFIWRYKGANS